MRPDPTPDPTAHPLWPVVVVLGEIAARLARDRLGSHLSTCGTVRVPNGPPDRS